MNEYVEGKVGPPGIALIVFGILALLLNLVGAAFQALGAVSQIMILLDSSAGTDQWVAWFTSQGISLIIMLGGFIWSIIIILAGARLRSARSAGLVYAGSVMAMLPCCVSYCCCLGLPLGVWAIMTMQDEQVKAAFAEA